MIPKDLWEDERVVYFHRFNGLKVAKFPITCKDAPQLVERMRSNEVQGQRQTRRNFLLRAQRILPARGFLIRSYIRRGRAHGVLVFPQAGTPQFKLGENPAWLRRSIPEGVRDDARTDSTSKLIMLNRARYVVFSSVTHAQV